MVSLKALYYMLSLGISVCIFVVCLSAYNDLAFVTDVFIHTEKLNQSINKCTLQIAESIPVGLKFSEHNKEFISTYEAWSTLLNLATDSVNIGSFYWTMRGIDIVNDSTANQGEDIFNRLLKNGQSKNIKIKIAQNMPTNKEPNKDTVILQEAGAAEVRSVNFTKLFGGGVLHTKMWIVDNKHFYVGSANMDWRSLTQVKELGLLGINCSSLAADIQKIFNIYWYLGQSTALVPDNWPPEYSTNFNIKNPMSLRINDIYQVETYVSNSPHSFSALGRSDDLDAILSTIELAEKYIYIAVMDYFPLIIYTENPRYWPLIDDAIRKAAIERNISIKMLISWWQHSKSIEDSFLRSLQSLSNSLYNIDIQIKRFVVPSYNIASQIPFSRVNHNKYMVTDNTAYIGTSNWSGDYFENTAGVGLILKDTGSEKHQYNRTIRINLRNIFLRDWESQYSINFR